MICGEKGLAVEKLDSQTQEIIRLKHALERESAARREAETVAEKSKRALFHQRERSQLLQEIAEAANEAVAIEEAFQIALEKICEHTGWPVGHFYLCAEDTPEKLISTPIWHPKNSDQIADFRHVLERIQFVPGVGMTGRVLSSGKPAWVNDVRDDTIFLTRAPGLEKIGLKAAFAFPVFAGTKIVGILEFFSDKAQKPNEPFLEVMAHLGTQLGRVVERQRAQEALQKREEYFRHLTQNALDLITILNGDGTIHFESPSMQQVLGYDEKDYLGRNAFEFVHPDDLLLVSQAFTEALQNHGNTKPLTFRFRHKDGSWRILEGIGNNLLGNPAVSGIVFNSRDITERKRLEEQFLQSQKVQAIGQLAGGVAHDFNNILTAIIGYSDLMLRQMPNGAPHQDSAKEIRKAADRASALTRQLLAFSRKQLLQPKVLDLNAIVTDMDKMLRRLLGENIALVTIPFADLGRVKADPGQIEQVVLNLAVNARDAMPQKGTLTIETGNVTLDKNYASRNAEVTPGDYVMLAVTDNGSGMPPEVKARLFEPFFTTKETGKGTGLGLATCHGIVKQSNGHIAVYSELGQGTTFKVYLPRVAEKIEVVEERAQPVETPKGNETILLVEDEPMLRELAATMLGELGYRVFEADNGVQALRVIQENSTMQIDVLVTDVVMPEMGGKELADKLRTISPQTKVLFSSGYTEDAIVQGGVLDPGISFMQKPYTFTTLAQKVREALEKKS